MSSTTWCYVIAVITKINYKYAAQPNVIPPDAVSPMRQKSLDN